jgi:hypothetical protein
MRRRDFIKGVVGSTARPLAARAQQTGKLPTIGILGPVALSMICVMTDCLPNDSSPSCLLASYRANASLQSGRLWECAAKAGE